MASSDTGDERKGDAGCGLIFCSGQIWMAAVAEVSGRSGEVRYKPG
jgi:hypothetical protein